MRYYTFFIINYKYTHLWNSDVSDTIVFPLGTRERQNRTYQYFFRLTDRWLFLTTGVPSVILIFKVVNRQVFFLLKGRLALYLPTTARRMLCKDAVLQTARLLSYTVIRFYLKKTYSISNNTKRISFFYQHYIPVLVLFNNHLKAKPHKKTLFESFTSKYTKVGTR